MWRSQNERLWATDPRRWLPLSPPRHATPATAVNGFATQWRWRDGEFVSRENAGNECAGASAGMTAAWADSFPALSDTPDRTAAAPGRFHCKAAANPTGRAMPELSVSPIVNDPPSLAAALAATLFDNPQTPQGLFFQHVLLDWHLTR
jgi:hypothetical protein